MVSQQPQQAGVAGEARDSGVLPAGSAASADKLGNPSSRCEILRVPAPDLSAPVTTTRFAKNL